jgi:thioredoxin reductase (NADPH)
MSKIHDLLVIGTGIAGLSAARQGLRLGLSTAMMESRLFGGRVTNITELDGEIQGSGSDLAAEMMMEAADLGASNINATATAIERDAQSLIVRSDAGDQRARSIIVASGARLKRLGIPGEAEFQGKGVSNCADCDGPFFKGKDVVVVGGGDSALQEARVLAEFAQQVHIVHRGAKFDARAHLVEQLGRRKNMSVHWRSRVDAVLGEQTVRGVRIHGLDNAATGEIPCAGFFAYVGLEPASGFLPDAIARDAGGFVLTGADLQTAMAGVFAAGAVRSGCGGLLTDAIAEGAAAAKSAGTLVRA